MRVRAADAQRIDAGPQRLFAAPPVRQMLVDEERAVGKVDPRIGRVEVQRRRDLAMVDGQGRLDETGEARRDLQVGKDARQRADRTKLLLDRVLAEGLR